MRNVLRIPIIFGLFIAETLGNIEDCNYLDTVDLTNSTKYQNGSYQYEDIQIPKERTGEYDYQILFNGVIESVPKHIRGCVCHLKPCIRFCCNPKQQLVNDKRECGDIDLNLDYDTFLNITYNETQIKNVNVFKFMVQQHLPVPCSDHLYLDPDDPNHAWTLYDNGTLLRHEDNAELSKSDYCFQPQKFQDTYKLVPHHCISPPDLTNGYIQSVSIFFMIMVICVYLLLPNFKGVHFKCCICYFGCLTLTFILIVLIRFDWITTNQSEFCKLTGYIGYYLTISTFLWLLIINYDLWKTFNNIGISRRTRFLKYNIFVWCLAAVQLLITFIADFVLESSEWAPRVGEYICWIETMTMSAILYYYGPMSLYLTFNMTLFVKTAYRIFVQNRKNRLQLSKSECQRNLRNLTNFGMFFRLFIITGVIWILEVISFLFEMNDSAISIFDVITCSQGIILFAVTISKRDVLKSLSNRFGIGEKIAQGGSSITSASHVPMTEVALTSKETLSDGADDPQ